MKNMEQFLTENCQKGITEFRLVAAFDGKYQTSFYIHAMGHDSETLDMIVDDNILTPKFSEEQS